MDGRGSEINFVEGTGDGGILEPRRLPLQFSGSAGEYFRIWVVNVFLTMATLGFYAAWAKVRTRQYFYASTRLDGHGFEYRANAWAILKGNLVVVLGFAAYSASQAFDPLLSAAAALAFAAVVPFLIYKTLRFRARYSAYRNLRFRFAGSAGEAYGIYLLAPVAVSFTAGLLFPWWAFRQKRYLFDNLGWGSTPFRWHGHVGHFYRVYLVASLLAGLVLVVFGLLVAGVVGLAAGQSEPVLALGFALPSVVVILGLALVGQYVYARLQNYCWNHARVGPVGFESRLHPARLVWIRASNIAAILLSAGLLIPWAKVRRARYLVEHLTVVVEGDLDAFTAAAAEDVSAIGDAAADFFDFEIGL